VTWGKGKVGRVVVCGEGSGEVVVGGGRVMGIYFLQALNGGGGEGGVVFP